MHVQTSVLIVPVQISVTHVKILHYFLIVSMVSITVGPVLKGVSIANNNGTAFPAIFVKMGISEQSEREKSTTVRKTSLVRLNP